MIEATQRTVAPKPKRPRLWQICGFVILTACAVTLAPTIERLFCSPSPLCARITIADCLWPQKKRPYRLLKFNEKFELVGEDAVSWEFRQTTIVEIAKGAILPDNQPVTARGISYYIDMLKRGGKTSEFTDGIQSISETPDGKVKIELTRPDIGVAAKLEGLLGGSIFSSHRDMINVVFKLRATSPGAKTYAKSFATCAAQIKAHPMNSARKAPLLEYDITDESTLQLLFDDFNYEWFVELCAGSWDEGFAPCSYIEVERMPEFCRYMILFNIQKPELSTPATRRALALLLNRGQIEGDIFGASIGLDNLRARYPGIPNVFDLASAALGQDVAAAKRLLASDGWSEKDGVFQRDGKQLAISVCISPSSLNNRTSKAIAARVTQAWRKAGIVAIAGPVWSSDFSFDVTVAEFPLSPGFSWPISLRIGMDQDAFSSYDLSLSKICSYESARLAEKKHQLAITFNEEKRRRLLNEMNAVFLDECPAVFLFIQKPSFCLDEIDTRYYRTTEGPSFLGVHGK